ncbi:hypothetical protein BOTBODRAFT_410545 [Botryobasidium botryosum FD-172 SS1]|uniref:Uncharacterized protein n=1 Tax=Botryobasidium botryosum (strain FD-172 SS1) TaxID=930990 RepID=A0A067MDK6_BOTB1|nr:hypothetical protein BOTBODRAFT_410545 [Botryobasidium botryosum FD-172 SS1]
MTSESVGLLSATHLRLSASSLALNILGSSATHGRTTEFNAPLHSCSHSFNRPSTPRTHAPLLPPRASCFDRAHSNYRVSFRDNFSLQSMTF